MRVTAAVASVRDLLPQGGQLPELTWRARHRWIVRLLWAHAAVIPVYGLLRDLSVVHLALEALVIPTAALAASSDRIERRVRTGIASLGLLLCSGLLVHLSGGLIEMHFHFFVMVAVASLYQDWLPFLAAIAYVFVHHGIVGVLDPASVYNHPAAIAHPWRWAGVHAAFIAAESIACLATWRLNESLFASEHEARIAAEGARGDLAVLVDATAALTSSFDVAVMLQGLADIVVPAMADGCAVDLLEEDGTLTRVATSGRLSAAGEEMVLACLRSGVGGPASDSVGQRRTVFVAAVRGRSGVLGALSLESSTSGRELGDGAVRVAGELGRRVALAVDNARLYARERSVAVTLQKALLPEQLPEVPGVESAARYVAGGPDVDVGGDWYDVIPLSRGRLLLVMGDVVGRGEKAAALMGQLRSALRGHVLVEPRPAAVLSHLNRLLNELNRFDMATLLCALLDPAGGTVTVASAGHPPAALRDADGSVSWLSESTGPPLGALDRAVYTEVVSTVAPGCTLLLYTDGIVEDRQLSLDVGLDRLAAALADGPEAMEELCEHVLARTLLDRPASDDAALLAVRLQPLAGRLTFDLPRDVSSLEPLRATLGRWLVAEGATAEETYEVLLATCEAVANAIVHARGPAASRILLEAVVDGDLRIDVRDFGSWRPPGTGIGGRGLHIMETVMDRVDIDRSEAGTHVRMRRRLAAQSREAGA